MDPVIDFITGRFGPDLTLPWCQHPFVFNDAQCPSRAGDGWECTLQAGHGGIHRGGWNDGKWGAEWSTYPSTMLFPHGI